MKKTIFFLAILAFVSCHDLDWNDSVIVDTCNDACTNSFTVTLSDALQIASSFMTGREIIPLTRAEDLSVKSSFSIKDKKNDPLLHVVNYNGGGFAIIAGDMRLKPIQAYSSTGYFSDKIESYPLGLKIWIDCAETNKAKAVKNGDVLDAETQLAWMHYRRSNLEPEMELTRSLDPIIGPPQEEVDTLVGPFIQDSWYQDTPYNDSLQICTHYYPNGNPGQAKPVVGCLPLAIARVLRYNQIPYNYSWSSMPNNAPQTVETVSFIRDVHYAVKAYANNNGYDFSYNLFPVYYMGNIIDYVPGTGVDATFPIGAFLCNQYGYPAAITESYTTGANGKIRREMIDYHLVCILSGFTSTSGGHTWVCDGYHFHSLPVFGLDDEFLGAFENKYLHHCWGWENRAYDGWFQHYDFTPGAYDFHYNMKLTHRISELDNWNLGF